MATARLKTTRNGLYNRHIITTTKIHGIYMLLKRSEDFSQKKIAWTWNSPQKKDKKSVFSGREKV